KERSVCIISGPCLIKGCFSMAELTHRSKRSIRCRAYMHWSHVTAKPVFITKMKLSVYMKHFKCIRKTRLKSFIAVTDPAGSDRKSTRLNSSHVSTSYAVFCLKKKTK